MKKFLLLPALAGLPLAAATAQTVPTLPPVRQEFLDSTFTVLPSAAGARHRREIAYADSLGGEVRDYYLSGQLQSRGQYENIRREIIHGAYDTYYPSGQLESHTTSRHGQLEGEQLRYYPSGRVEQRVQYAAGKLTGSQCFDPTGQPVECPTVVEVMPIYSEGDGSDQTIIAAITRHFRYPRKALRAGITGRILLGFVVNEQGEVVNAHIEQGLEPTLDAAALEAVQKLKRFRQPGTQNGKPVQVRYAIPLNLNIQ